MSLYDEAKQTADFIKSKINNIPKTAIVLGSGLGPFAKEIEKEVELDYCRKHNIFRIRHNND